MPQRKKREKTPSFLDFVPDDFVNLNRVRFTYKSGKTQITLKKSFRPENLRYLKHIRRLDSVTFEDYSSVNATVLNELAPLGLRYLKIGVNECTDTDLAALEGFQDLKRLNLYCSSHVTDAGLSHIQKLALLTNLYIFNSKRITDEGFIPLTHLEHLIEYGEH